MKLCVTGGAGFIGSSVVRQAIEAGHKVLNIDKLTYASCLDNVAQAQQSPNYQFAQIDVCDGPALNKVFEAFQPDAVMHLAAESHVDRSISGPADFIQTNILGTFQLLEAARSYWVNKGQPEDFKFHHVSTDEVYGSLGDSGMFHETTSYQPNSPYSASKASSDHLVRAWHETYKLPILVTNCSNNYGPFQFPEKLIPVTILNALAGKNIPIYGKGLNVRDWLYVEDHADALLTVLNNGTIGRTYNIGGNNELSNIDLVNLICDLLDQKLGGAKPHNSLITYVADRAGHDFRYAIDSSRIQSELGWSPSMTVATGLEATVDWYLANENWWKPLLDKSKLA